jgi:hypothetical protein
LEWNATSFGSLLIESGAAILETNDERTLTGGSGWTLDGSETAHIGSLASTIAFQNKFVPYAGLSNTDPGEFGSVPSQVYASVCFANIYRFNSTFTSPPTPPTPPTGGVFLGSVVEVGSPDAGKSNPFLGTFKIVSAAPGGQAVGQPGNPYLGHIKVVANPPAGYNGANPVLGEVVVIGSAPAGALDPWLGSAETD